MSKNTAILLHDVRSTAAPFKLSTNVINFILYHDITSLLLKAWDFLHHNTV